MESIFVTDYCECWFTIKYDSIIDLKHLQHNNPLRSLFMTCFLHDKLKVGLNRLLQCPLQIIS